MTTGSIYIALRRVTKPGDPVRGIAGSTHYETRDGRFRIQRIDMHVGCVWQIEALDGSAPFGYRGRKSPYFNGDTLGECREELAMIYDESEG